MALSVSIAVECGNGLEVSPNLYMLKMFFLNSYLSGEVFGWYLKFKIMRVSHAGISGFSVKVERS